MLYFRRFFGGESEQLFLEGLGRESDLCRRRTGEKKYLLSRLSPFSCQVSPPRKDGWESERKRRTSTKYVQRPLAMNSERLGEVL